MPSDPNENPPKVMLTTMPPHVQDDDRSVIERVLLVISDGLCIDPVRVTPEAELVRDLEADSLDLLEITMALEDEFGVEIADDELVEGNPKTVQQVADLVTKRLGEVAVRP